MSAQSTDFFLWLFDFLSWGVIISAVSLALRPFWVEPWFWLTEAFAGALLAFVVPAAFSLGGKHLFFFSGALMAIMAICYLLKRRWPSEPGNEKLGILERLFHFRVIDLF